MTGASDLPKLLLVTAGFLIWSLCLVVLYSVLSLGCETGLGDPSWSERSGLNILLAALWVLHIGLTVGALAGLYYARSKARSEAGRFLLRVTCLLAISGGIATLWIGFPVLVLPPCA